MLFRRISDDQAIIRQGDDRGHHGPTVTVWDDAGLPILHVRNQRIGGAEIDTDYSCHIKDEDVGKELLRRLLLPDRSRYC